MEELYGEILIYQTEDGLTNINVKMQDDTVWLTQQQLVELYQSSKSNAHEEDSFNLRCGGAFPVRRGGICPAESPRNVGGRGTCRHGKRFLHR